MGRNERRICLCGRGYAEFDLDSLRAANTLDEVKDWLIRHVRKSNA